eukprot:6183481-Pleurochrysis_carterae.AAC.4
MIFPLWDAIQNEYVIKHPRLVWDELYVQACALYRPCPASHIMSRTVQEGDGDVWLLSAAEIQE